MINLSNADMNQDAGLTKYQPIQMRIIVIFLMKKEKSKMLFSEETKDTIVLTIKIAALYAAVVGFTLFIGSNI